VEVCDVSAWQQKQRERQARFWELIRKGWTNTAACEAVGVERRQGYRWRKAAGGRIPEPVRVTSGRYLSLEERLAIADLHMEGKGVREIAAVLNRAPSTISRELERNASGGDSGGHPGSDSGGDSGGWSSRPRRGRQRRRYAPYAAQKRAELRARRPKACKLDHAPLVEVVEDRLERKWSPEQIRDELRRLFPDQPEMQVSHETIYQSLFVQGRGHLRADLHKQLRTGRAMRRPRGCGTSAKATLPDIISISERPAEADDRAVPGHWEGDLILGTNCRSAIGTLVERSTRFVILVPLLNGHTALEVRDALIPAIRTVPEQLRRSLTWDRGTEMARHRDITFSTDMAIYFADPHSPWQRGSNENTNGLLRQYFPKGTDLSVHNPEHLADVAAELNSRPRRTLDGLTPAAALDRLLSAPTPVATTA
jgi:IS30 family transposase